MPDSENNQRIGFHYYPDTVHYRVKDLERWIPELIRLGAGWLTLLAPLERAIPEFFLKTLIRSGINPVIHFPIPTWGRVSERSLRILLHTYAGWGVRWAAFFDQPNLREAWSASDWAQIDLVERFIDLWLPVAEIAVQERVSPLFPPLKPGGDYWDLSFLEGALQSLKRRGQNQLLEKIGLSAYAWTGSRSLDWGAGGPNRWPDARPYLTPDGTEDHLGFHIFDWYEAVALKEVGHEIPIFLLRAGSVPGDMLDAQTGEPDLIAHADRNLKIADLLEGLDDAGNPLISPHVICCNFWLLANSGRNLVSRQVWFREDLEPLPVVKAFYRRKAQSSLINNTPFPPAFRSGNEPVQSVESEKVAAGPADVKSLDVQLLPNEEQESNPLDQDPDVEPAQKENPNALPSISAETERTISHYVLLPLYAWGAADWDLSVIQTFLQDSHPTIGFSLTEACTASRVTVVGGEGAISAEALELLRANGCYVERILDDGTLVAS